jgi:hypothetical protein
MSLAHANRFGSRGDVSGDNSIGSDLSVITDDHVTQNLCSCTNVDMTANFGKTMRVPHSNSNLLKYQAIYPNFYVWMYNDAIRMGYQQPSPYLAIQRNVGARDDAPETMADDQQSAQDGREYTTSLLPVLVSPDRQK